MISRCFVYGIWVSKTEKEGEKYRKDGIACENGQRVLQKLCTGSCGYYDDVCALSHGLRKQ